MLKRTDWILGKTSLRARTCTLKKVPILFNHRPSEQNYNDHEISPTTPPLLIEAHISRSIFLFIHSFSSAVPISSIPKVIMARGLIVFTMIVIPGCHTVLSHCRRHCVVCLSFLGPAHRSQPGLIALHAISAKCSNSPSPSSTTSTTPPTRRPRYSSWHCDHLPGDPRHCDFT